MFKRITSIAFLAMLMLHDVFCQAQQIIPMPIPIGGGGRLNLSTGLAIVIASNIVFLSIWFIRIAIFFIKKPDNTFVEYTIWSNLEYFIDFNTICFGIVNGLALFIQLVSWINGMMPK